MRYVSLFCILFFSYITQAQHILSGKISDLNTGETLIGATILHADGEGTVSNYDGYFELRLKRGIHYYCFLCRVSNLSKRDSD